MDVHHYRGEALLEAGDAAAGCKQAANTAKTKHTTAGDSTGKNRLDGAGPSPCSSTQHPSPLLSLTTTRVRRQLRRMKARKAVGPSPSS